MLKYRDNAEKCVERAKDLLLDDLNLIQKEMTIDEWLLRLNLLHLKEHFEKHKIRRVEDLAHFPEEG